MNEKMINELKAKRMTLTNEMRAHMDLFTDKVMDSEATSKLANMQKDFDAMTDRITAEETMLANARIAGEGAPSGSPNLNDRMEAFRNAMTGKIDAVTAFKNNYTLGTDAEAGFLTAPVEFVAEVIRGLDDEIFMRNISRVISGVGAGQALGFPYRKTKANAAAWKAEITALDKEATLDYGRREFKPNKLGSLILMSEALANHSTLAIPELQKEIVYNVGTIQENAYLNGNGTAQPLGVFTASASGISTGRDISTDNTGTAVTFDGLMNAKFSLAGQYHKNLSWVAHRDFYKQVSKIKDGTGNYIWQPSVIAGQADRLLGHAVNMSEYAPNTFTTGLYVAVLGDFKQGYMITDSQAISIKVLDQLYAETNQIGYRVSYYGDGAPVLEEAFARVKLG